MLAGVADCGKSQKWGYRGGARLEFKQKGRAIMWDGDDGRQWGTMRDNVRPCGERKG